jgi:predicted negative regulator of RcsB-dependent stress response
MIGAEAKIAEAYHAIKANRLDHAERILKPIPHPRAEALLEEIAKLRIAAKA